MTSGRLLVAILDDDAERRALMRGVLSAIEMPLDSKFFDNAPAMIAWLAENLDAVALVSLDHDLGPNWRETEQVFDPGTGRDVANFMATVMPSCPVIIHSSNGFCVTGMMMELEGAGWSTRRVVPFNVLDWIRASWAATVRECLTGPG